MKNNLIWTCSLRLLKCEECRAKIWLPQRTAMDWRWCHSRSLVNVCAADGWPSVLNSFFKFIFIRFPSQSGRRNICSTLFSSLLLMCLTTVILNLNTHLVWHTTVAVWRCQPTVFHWEAHKTAWRRHRWHTVRGYTWSSSTRFSGGKRETNTRICQKVFFLLHL